MISIGDEDIKRIVRAAEEEFPNDPALQQIHFARGIITKEAELEGLSFADYVRKEALRIRNLSKSA
jgi:hypothetical protein